MTQPIHDQPAAQSSGIKPEETRVQLQGSAAALSMAQHRARMARVEMERLAHAVEVITALVNLAPPAGKAGVPVTPETLAHHEAEAKVLRRDAVQTLQTQRDHLVSALRLLLDELDLNLPI